ncbi:PREDICTED: UDP-glycosyltransferase 90A1-like [Nelumbo nucifera]|uniref:Glycosyltransferase n=1 Tax=Nelumbo nucifera TaxID=4432 RepID=A0A1U8Q8G2_NELNU|nr:PREDICTED: UDP-glycosyltransferase 90A1-like [Nelumbo nucifera]
MDSNNQQSSLHIVFFPFMSKGHMIPLLHLARLLFLRRVSVTFFTTPANSPFIRQHLSNTDSSLVHVVELKFPENAPEIPPGVESTDRLPSMSLFVPFAKATRLMQPDFEQVLQSLPSVSCIISDGFLSWTQKSASKFGIPRAIFYGMNNFAASIFHAVIHNRFIANVKSDDEPFTFPDFPWLKFTKNDFTHPFDMAEPSGPHYEFIVEEGIAASQSQGIVVNSFCELETRFIEYWDREHENTKAWCVGPLCLVEPPTAQPLQNQKPTWMQWLDHKSAEGRSVLYVAFGTQAEISQEQFQAIAEGLERSNVSFLWVIKSREVKFLVDGYKERVKDRGLVVSEWVNQREILEHQSVNGFISHCGWNSVLESICASVPILAWPLMADQYLNARLVVDEMGMGLRVVANNGSVRGFIESEMVEKMVKELMEGEDGEKARKKMMEISKTAKSAIDEGGSSWRTLDRFLDEVCKRTS